MENVVPETMNAITTELAEELRGALSEGADDAGVIVIRGAGGNFCAGGDFNHLQEIRTDPDALRNLFETFVSTCNLIAELPVPVLAEVQGVAMAGGFELMLSCDFSLVADDARIADEHSNHAMIPGGGSTRRPLADRVGRGCVCRSGKRGGPDGRRPWTRCGGRRVRDSVADQNFTHNRSNSAANAATSPESAVSMRSS